MDREHTGALAKFHHDRAMRVKARSEIKAKHKANPIVSKIKSTAKGLEDAPNAAMHPSTMKNKTVQRLYSKTLQSHLDKHRAANPGLPKGKVQEGFSKVTMPAVYRHLKAPKYNKAGDPIHPGWDSPNRTAGLRGKPGMTEWHKACKQCAASVKAKGLK